MTGAGGSIGRLLVPLLVDRGYTVFPTDVDTLDVTYANQVAHHLEKRIPSVVFHLAGAKHAPEGETDPEYVSIVNTAGTANVVRVASRIGAKVIFASTCKAADPETAYGASKLIAERIVLNAGGVVVRYYNVRETEGNVFRTWEQIPDSEPIPWTNCWRYFISVEDALDLTMAGLHLPSGRYTVEPGPSTSMYREARRLYPGREFVQVAARRGDRLKEPLRASSESMVRFKDFWRISSPHDPPFHA